MRPWRLRLPPWGGWLIALILATPSVALGTDSYRGLVTFGGLPVPGATITATPGERQVVAASDAEGVFRLIGLDEGSWTVRVEKLGFRAVTREVILGDDAAASEWELIALRVAELEPLVRLGGESARGGDAKAVPRLSAPCDGRSAPSQAVA